MMKEWKETIWRRQYTILGDKLFDSFHLPSWWVTLYTPVTSHPGLTILTIRSIRGPWCCVDHISLSLNFSGYTPVAQQLPTKSCLLHLKLISSEISELEKFRIGFYLVDCLINVCSLNFERNSNQLVSRRSGESSKLSLLKNN